MIEVSITTKNGNEEENAVKAILEKLIVEYPCPIFTRDILIESRVVPHSHPVLTLNTRNTDPLLILETFVHEQFHWFCVLHSNSKDCFAYLKKYPDLGDCNKSGSYPESFWAHLIVNWNTRNFLQKNLTKEHVDFIYSQWQPYPLTEKFVEEKFEVLREDLAKFNMIY